MINYTNGIMVNHFDSETFEIFTRQIITKEIRVDNLSSESIFNILEEIQKEVKNANV